MSLRMYDEAILNKIKSWFPAETETEILTTDDNTVTTRLEEAADKNHDEITIPKITISRDPDFDIGNRSKRDMSYDGPVIKKLSVEGKSIGAIKLNSIPVSFGYQIDIYTRTFADMDKILVSLIFKLIKNPRLVVTVEDEFNQIDLPQVHYITIDPHVHNTSNVGERRYVGQFVRYTLRLMVPSAAFYQIEEASNIKISARLDVDEDTSKGNVINSR